jgi:hypothetical protein
LQRPGRKYEEAVKTFQPYDKVKEPYPDARAAGSALITEGKAAGTARKTFIYVNNRLEGNALETISAMTTNEQQQIRSAIVSALCRWLMHSFS